MAIMNIDIYLTYVNISFMKDRVDECKQAGVTYIGIPSGSLQHHTVQLLIDAGYLQEHPGKNYEIVCPENPRIIFRIIDRIDMSRRIVRGVVHGGFAPEDYRREMGVTDDQVALLADLPFSKQTRGKSKLVLASKPDLITSIEQCRGESIGTELPNLTRDRLRLLHGFTDQDLARIERSHGKTEELVPFGVTNVITDVTETGSALRANGMSIIGDPLFLSCPQFAANKETVDAHWDVFQELLTRFRAALDKEVEPMTMIEMNVPVALKNAVLDQLPAAEAVDRIVTEDNGIVVLRSLVPRKGIEHLMYRLLCAGANNIYEDAGKTNMTQEMRPRR